MCVQAEATLLGQLTALQADLNAHALEAAQLRMDAAGAREACAMAQQHAADLAQQLQVPVQRTSHAFLVH